MYLPVVVMKKAFFDVLKITVNKTILLKLLVILTRANKLVSIFRVTSDWFW